MSNMTNSPSNDHYLKGFHGSKYIPTLHYLPIHCVSQRLTQTFHGEGKLEDDITNHD
jgi:hypothetical protein